MNHLSLFFFLSSPSTLQFCSYSLILTSFLSFPLLVSLPFPPSPCRHSFFFFLRPSPCLPFLILFFFASDAKCLRVFCHRARLTTPRISHGADVLGTASPLQRRRQKSRHRQDADICRLWRMPTAMHYGSKQPDIETTYHSLSHQLGNE